MWTASHAMILRQSFVTNLLDAGADLDVAQKLAGHRKWYDSDLRQTGEAAKLSAVELVRIPIGHQPTFLREAVREHDPQGLAITRHCTAATHPAALVPGCGGKPQAKKIRPPAVLPLG